MPAAACRELLLEEVTKVGTEEGEEGEEEEVVVWGKSGRRRCFKEVEEEHNEDTSGSLGADPMP